jgi:hypothetical protein
MSAENGGKYLKRGAGTLKTSFQIYRQPSKNLTSDSCFSPRPALCYVYTDQPDDEPQTRLRRDEQVLTNGRRFK